MPEIYNPSMPSPIKERYYFGSDIRLPCDDRKVADHIQCEEYHVYCTDPEQMIDFSVQGSGEIFSIRTTCERFMMMSDERFNW
jgi:hypothetical protein